MTGRVVSCLHFPVGLRVTLFTFSSQLTWPRHVSQIIIRNCTVMCCKIHRESKWLIIHRRILRFVGATPFLRQTKNSLYLLLSADVDHHWLLLRCFSNPLIDCGRFWMPITGLETPTSVNLFNFQRNFYRFCFRDESIEVIIHVISLDNRLRCLCEFRIMCLRI